MDTNEMRMLPRIALLFVLAAVSACAPDQKIPTLLGATAPGFSDWDTQSPEEKANEKWWHHYYGEKAEGE